MPKYRSKRNYVIPQGTDICYEKTDICEKIHRMKWFRDFVISMCPKWYFLQRKELCSGYFVRYSGYRLLFTNRFSWLTVVPATSHYIW